MTTHGIEQISVDDLAQLKELALKAIIDSVDASDNIKGEIVADTMAHIDKCATATQGVFLKYTESAILGFILVQDYWNLSSHNSYIVFP